MVIPQTPHKWNVEMEEESEAILVPSKLDIKHIKMLSLRSELSSYENIPLEGNLGQHLLGPAL